MTASTDHWIDEFGRELDPIYSRGRKAKGARGSARGANEPRTRSTGLSARESRRAILERIARKSPEVMVKITGGGRCVSQIKAHMDYISRNGRVELEDEQGLTYLGTKDVRHVRDAWRDGGHTIPNDGVYEKGEGPREAFNIMLSMPPGTDRQAVKDAARAFAAREFEGFQYVFAAHDDEKHPHVHLAVKARGIDGTRLNPRKGDLHRWRVEFAHELRERGVDANASPRKARGIVKKAERQAIRGIVERKGKSSVLRKHHAEALREARGRAKHVNPAQDKISANRKRLIQLYGELAKGLAKGGEADQRLALQLVGFVQTMPPPTTKHEDRVQTLSLDFQSAGKARSQTNRERNDSSRA